MGALPLSNMRIAITGTTSGLGMALKTTLSKQHEVLCIDKPYYNLSDLSVLNNIDLSNFDVLINNAGHAHGGGVGLVNHNSNDWVDIIAINLTAPVFLTQRFVQQNQSGKVIYITSKSIEKNIGGDSVYSASKSGLSTFIKCMRDEYADSKFKFVEIRPGRVKTEFAKNRRIHSQETIKNFYNERTHLDVCQVVTAIEHALQSDIFETITISK